jgi:hypothetical protein
MRMRILHSFQHLHLAGLNHGDHLLTLHARKAVQKVFDGFAPFQVINEILQRDTRANEHGRAAKDFRVRMNDPVQLHKAKPTAPLPCLQWQSLVWS